MPTVLNISGYRFIIFLNDHLPKHIHVKKAEGGAKVNLEPIEVVEHYQLTRRQINEIRKITEENQEYLLAKWQELQGGDE